MDRGHWCGLSVIATDNLTKRYGARRGVENVDLDVPPGILFGFLGPNGAGKTTTIRLLLGFLRPSGGSAQILGHDCWSDSQRIKHDVGYLPGDLRLYPRMNGIDVLRVFGLIRGRDLMTSGRDLADRFELDLSVPARKMSRGMRQKLGLIAALAPEPKLLVLDEPTASLDPLMQETLMSHLRDLASRGHTIFFSSHTLSEVERLCDRIAIVREGRVVADDSLTALRERATREVTIRWKPDADLDSMTPPPFLDLEVCEDHLWRGRLIGSVTPLLDWVDSSRLDDLSIARPDLDSLFRQYYRMGREDP